MTNVRFTDTEGNELAAPKARTFKAIKRSIDSANRAGCGKSFFTPAEHRAVRAVQYALHALSGDAPHSSNMGFSCDKRCRFERAPDGSQRVRAVTIDDDIFEIPHWDFVERPAVETIDEGVFA